MISSKADKAPVSGASKNEVAVATGYGKRSLVETAIGRDKSIIGRRLRARSFAAQQTEVAIGCTVLNQLLARARPKAVRSPPFDTRDAQPSEKVVKWAPTRHHKLRSIVTPQHLDRHRRRRGALFHHQLVEDLLQVFVDGARRHLENICDLLVGLAVRDP